MNPSSAARDWAREIGQGWDRFWFQPTAPHTLAAIRMFAGAMLFYTHLVWTLGLTDFLGPAAWIDRETARGLASQAYVWSPFFFVESPALLWLLHLVALTSTFCLMIGYQTRIASVVAWVMTLSYCHRLQGSLFGLDQINAMLAMYLMIGPAGAVYSLDRWLAKRRGDAAEEPASSVSANVAIRLIQLHMCIIYLFGGIGKMRGEMWWDGSAMWYAAANYEYQSLDLTWLAYAPVLISLLTHMTVFWETFYCFLVWPRLTRPIMLGLAVMVHGGIALFLGMITFGLAMLIGNLAFVPPEIVRGVERAIGRRLTRGRAGESGDAKPPQSPPSSRARRKKRAAA